MTEIVWPVTPLATMTDLHGKTFPPDRILWAPNTNFTFTGVASSLTFAVHLISDGTADSSKFRIGIETIDWENDNTDVVHQETYSVHRGHPRDVMLEVPIMLTRVKFRVTLVVMEMKYPYGDSRVYTAATSTRITRIPRCFIATAAYGSELAPPVQFLREFRDDVILKSRYSRAFEKVLEGYYTFSPPIAAAMIRNKAFKYFMKYTVVWPFIALVGASVLIIKLFADDKKGPSSR